MVTATCFLLPLGKRVPSTVWVHPRNHPEPQNSVARNSSSSRKRNAFVYPTFSSSLLSSNRLRVHPKLKHLAFTVKSPGYGKVSVKAMNYPGTQEEIDLQGERIAEDYYSILGLTPDATPDEIKKAYYACMKACHPDLNKSNPENVEFCMFINEIYEVLSDPDMRAVYDEINGYTITGINPFRNPNQILDHCFVDEFTCIGCKNCANTAENTFDIEPLYGRARVMSQKSDPVPKIQEAIETCPVNCIHWVSSAQLTLLEDEMRRIERVNVALMLANMGNRGADVFQQAAWRWDKRQAQAVERARVKLATEMKNKSKSWWNGYTSDVSDSEGSGSLDAEKMARAAAAARRWREYSRSGVDRKATRAISDTIIAKMQEEDEEAEKGDEEKAMASI